MRLEKYEREMSQEIWKTRVLLHCVDIFTRKKWTNNENQKMIASPFRSWVSKPKTYQRRGGLWEFFSDIIKSNWTKCLKNWNISYISSFKMGVGANIVLDENLKGQFFNLRDSTTLALLDSPIRPTYSHDTLIFMSFTSRIHTEDICELKIKIFSKQ